MEQLSDILLENYLSNKPLYVFEHITTDYNSYYIEVYKQKDEHDKEYISKNKKAIKAFLDAGYEAAHLGKFIGCNNPNSVKQNTAMLKVARDKATNQIIAMTIYSSRWGGLKCVGGTVIVTDDKELRNMGKEALTRITQEDVKLWGQFVWTECSGAIKKIWEKENGIMIPSAYLQLFMDEKTLSTVEFHEDDPYTYSRVTNIGTVDETRIDKVIFGFPNRAVLEKYIRDTNTTLEKLCADYGVNPEDIINEGFQYRDAPKNIWPQLKLLKYYYQEFLRGRMEITEEESKVLTKAVSDVCTEMEHIWDRLGNKQTDGLWNMMYKVLVLLNQANILRIYEFGVDLLETEQEKFPSSVMMPLAF